LNGFSGKELLERYWDDKGGVMQETYNYKVVRQFAVMAVVWGIVGMAGGRHHRRPAGVAGH
jgi:hypothetical protein